MRPKICCWIRSLINLYLSASDFQLVPLPLVLLHKSKAKRDNHSRRSYALASTGTVAGRPWCANRLSKAARASSTTNCSSKVCAFSHTSYFTELTLAAKLSTRWDGCITEPSWFCKNSKLTKIYRLLAIDLALSRNNETKRHKYARENGFSNCSQPIVDPI